MNLETLGDVAELGQLLLSIVLSTTKNNMSCFVNVML